MPNTPIGGKREMTSSEAGEQMVAERDEARAEAQKHVGHTEYWRERFQAMAAAASQETDRATKAEQELVAADKVNNLMSQSLSGEREARIAAEQALARERERGERMEKLLRWLNMKGGLGLDVHDRISAALSPEKA
jgi:hypothetical protein